MPPPTVNGMNTCSATRSTTCTIVSRSSRRRGDVEEHELVGALGVVARRELDRIAGVADLDEAARPSRRGPRRRRGTGSRGRRARGDPFLDREPLLVDRVPDDRTREPPAVDLERRERAQVVERCRRRRSRSPAPPSRASTAASCSRSGPASMPSRPMSVTTSAPTPGIVEALRERDEIERRSPRPSRGSRRRGRGRRARPRPGPGCSVGELVDELRAARPRRCRSRHACTPAANRSPASSTDRTPPPVCTAHRHVRADRLDHRRGSGRRRRARRRDRRRGSSARRAASKRARDRDRIVVVDASRGRSRPAGAARPARRAGRSPDRGPSSRGRGRSTKLREQRAGRPRPLFSGWNCVAHSGPALDRGREAAAVVAPRRDDRVVGGLGRVRVHEVAPRGIGQARDAAASPARDSSVFQPICGSRTVVGQPRDPARRRRRGRRRRATRRCRRTASACRRRSRGTGRPSVAAVARDRLEAARRAARACTRRSCRHRAARPRRRAAIVAGVGR